MAWVLLYLLALLVSTVSVAPGLGGSRPLRLAQS